VRCLLTAGQASEYGQANALIEGFNTDFVLADKGYDSNDFIENIKAIGAVPVIPPGCNRNELRGYDRLAQNYLSMLHLASVLIWLN